MPAHGLEEDLRALAAELEAAAETVWLRPDPVRRRRRLLLLLGASYALLSAQRLGYKAEYAARFLERGEMLAEVKEVARDLASENGVLLKRRPRPGRQEKWLGGYYFGSAAFRLHSFCDSFQKCEDQTVTSKYKDPFKKYVDWFKHDTGSHPGAELGVAEGAAYLRELLRVERSLGSSSRTRRGRKHH